MLFRKGLSLSHLGVSPEYYASHATHDIVLEVDREFRNSRKHWRGVPLVMGGVWSFDSVVSLTELGILSSVQNQNVEDLVNFYREEDTRRAIFPVDFARFEDDIVFNEVRDRLVDKTKLKYARVNVSHLTIREAAEVIKEFRSANPNLVIFADRVYGPNCADRLYLAGADVVVVGEESADSAWMLEEGTGVALSQVDLIQEARCSVLADVWCQTPGEVAKALLLGADFVGIGPDMSGYKIEEILAGLRLVCTVSGHSNLQGFCSKARLMEKAS